MTEPTTNARALIEHIAKSLVDDKAAVFLDEYEDGDETVIELARPFARQERLDGLAALEELRAVSPAAVRGVREGHSRWIAAVPCVLGQTHFLGGRRNVEGR